MPRVLTIAGSDSGGGAGIQADLKVRMGMGGSLFWPLRLCLCQWLAARCARHVRTWRPHRLTGAAPPPPRPRAARAPQSIMAMGAFGMSAVTALTAQNSRGVQAVHAVPPAFLAAQLDSVLGDLGADAVKTGMLPDAETVSLVAAKVKQYGVGVAGGGPGHDLDERPRARGGCVAAAMVRELLPLAAGRDAKHPRGARAACGRGRRR